MVDVDSDFKELGRLLAIQRSDSDYKAKMARISNLEERAEKLEEEIHQDFISRGMDDRKATKAIKLITGLLKNHRIRSNEDALVRRLRDEASEEEFNTEEIREMEEDIEFMIQGFEEAQEDLKNKSPDSLGNTSSRNRRPSRQRSKSLVGRVFSRIF